MTFNKLTHEQVSGFFWLHAMLRKLRVIGIVQTTTERAWVTEFGKPVRYHLRYKGYDHTMKNKLTAEEYFDMYFEASSDLEDCIRQTE